MPAPTVMTTHASRQLAPRLVAGALAGLAGGVAFGVLMVVPAVGDAQAFDGIGTMTGLSRLLGTDHLGILWGAHAVLSILFGVAFALLVRPLHARRTVPMGLAWGALLWLVNGVLLVPLLMGGSLRLDGGAVFNLLGHLAYGGVLGLAYVAFFREEEGLMRDHPGARASARRPAAKP